MLITRTGLRHLQMYYSLKVIFLYLPYYRCHRQLSSEDLCAIIAKVFYDIGFDSCPGN